MMNLFQNRHFGVRHEAIRNNELIFVDPKTGSGGSGETAAGA